jgi:hypothetical protein
MVKESVHSMLSKYQLITLLWIGGAIASFLTAIYASMSGQAGLAAFLYIIFIGACDNLRERFWGKT